MTDTIDVSIDDGRETRLVDRCRHMTERHGLSSVHEYADDWLDSAGVFALDPANLPPEQPRICTPPTHQHCRARSETPEPL